MGRVDEMQGSRPLHRLHCFSTLTNPYHQINEIGVKLVRVLWQFAMGTLLNVECVDREENVAQGKDVGKG